MASIQVNMRQMILHAVSYIDLIDNWDSNYKTSEII